MSASFASLHTTPCATVLFHYGAQTMTRDEYEARKRRLEEDLRSGMELLQAAFQTQFRALEMVWMGASGEPVSMPQAAPAPAAPETKRPARRSVGQVYADLLA